MQSIIIAIDGPSSSGKSTLAKQLAAALNYNYVDSGAFYRAATLHFHELGLDLKQHEQLIAALEDIHMNTTYNPSTDTWQTILNGRNVESEIRGITISNLVSEVSAIPEVRSFIVSKLRRYGNEKGIVMDGRDIGTVVFPEAELKIYMTADEKVRSKRRFEELKRRGLQVTESQISENLAGRDLLDRTREMAPLRKAEDAIVLDNTNLTEQQQIEQVLKLARLKISEHN
jgi:cytidylate kinase